MIITASDRKTLIHFASGLTKGSNERRVILSSLRRKARYPSEKKDYDRLNSMQTKSMRGEDLDLAKMEQLARNMAKAVKDWKKAERRGSAAELIGVPSVAQIFFDRADELKEGLEETPLTKSDRNVHRAWAIPAGPLNLSTGDNRIFNFADEWGGEDMSLTIGEDFQKKRVLIVGHGGPSWKRGETIDLESDQTRRYLGQYTIVKNIRGSMTVDLLAQVARAAGKRSLPAYILK